MRFLFHHRIATLHGQAVHMNELVDALEALGHEVILVGPQPAARNDFGAGSHWVSALKRRLPRAGYELLELAYSAVAFVRLLGAVRRHRPDAVYERYGLYLLAGVAVRRRTKVPLLLEVNSPMVEERRAFDEGIALDGLARWAERTAWRGADVVLPVTQVLADDVRRAGVPEDRIVVVPNGIDLDRFRPVTGDAVRARLGLDGRLVLGFVGFVRDWHRLDRVVAMLPRLAERMDAHLLVVGDGPAVPDLVEQSRRLGVGDRLTVTGVVPRDQVGEHVGAFDVALQIGVTAFASPLKLFEYMALERAVVAPDTPNIAEVLTDGANALLVPPDDDEALEGALVRLGTDADLRRRLGAGARRTLVDERRTWQANAERVAELAQRASRR